MQESEKTNLFKTLQSEIERIIEEKRDNIKLSKKLRNLNVKVNFGLQLDINDFYWVNLITNNGKYKLSQDRLSTYDFELKITPEDLLYFLKGRISIIYMITEKNKYGSKKLVIEKGTSGRNLVNSLKLLKILKAKKPDKRSDGLESESKETPLIKKKYKLMTATLIGIFLPMILSLLFMVTLEEMPRYLEWVNGNVGVLFSMIIFNTFNIMYDIPLFGESYWIVFIIWGVTGIFIGIISRDLIKSLIIDGIAIIVNIIIYSISVSIFYPYFPPDFVNPIITQNYLWDGLVSGLLIPFYLLLQITIESFALPMIILFTLIGGLINPRPEIYSIFDAKRAQKIKDKYKDSPNPN